MQHMSLIISGGLTLTPKLYTSTEARAILRVGKTRMNHLLVSGKLKSFKDGHQRRITEQALNEYIAAQMATAA